MNGCAQRPGMRPLIIIFAKAPVAGRAKTRLDADPRRAAALHSAFVRDALAMAETLQDEADVELSTDTPCDAWPESAVRRSLQAEGSLGERMYAALDRALSSGRTKVVIMASDSPLLPPDYIRELLRSDADVALGPTGDGGYYAICCRRAVAEMFDGVPWSTDAALAGTVDALRRCGLTVAQGPGWFDLDTPDDLERLMQLLARPPLSSRAIALLEAISVVPNFLLDPQDLVGLAAYLHKTQLIPNERVVSAERIGDGNMNLTVRLHTSSRTLILKQARPWVEKYPHIPAPVERASVEAAFYRVIATRPDLSRRMPQLYGFDDAARLLVLEDLGERSDLMGLYRGDPLPEAACLQLVGFLSMLHACAIPAREAHVLRNRAMRKLNYEHQYDLPLRKDNGLDLDRITPGLEFEAARLRSDFKYCARVAELGSQYLSDGPVLVHGDFFPGSWLQTGGSLAVIDPEFCFPGPREYDIGVFLAHLHLINAHSRWSLVEASYDGPVNWPLARQFAGAEIMRRLIGVAQLPVPPDLTRKREWLELSRRLICD
jgi:5-methylthioribose kinase